MIGWVKTWRRKITPSASQIFTCVWIESPGNLVKNADSGSAGLQWLPDGAVSAAGPQATR